MKVNPRWAAIAVIVLAAVVIAGWYAAERVRPAAAALLERLPAGADAYLVVDLERLQSNPALRKLLADSPEASPTDEYRRLMEASGFRYQDDLRQLAAAKIGENLVGSARIKAEGEKIVSYLDSEAATKSEHRGTTIYQFGNERPFRVALIGEDTAVFSIGPNSTLLSDAIDRHTTGASGSAGDELRRSGQLTAETMSRALWLVGDTNRLYAANPQGPRAGPFQFGQEWFEGSRTITAWIESSPLNLEVELRSKYVDSGSAQRSASAFKAVLSVLQAIPPQPSQDDQDYSRLVAGVGIRHVDDTVVIHWRLEPGMLMSLAQ